MPISDIISQGPKASADLSLATLSSIGHAGPDLDAQVQARADAHWSARKVCAVLKVTSSIINALVVEPGGDSSDADLEKASVELMRRASDLTDCAMALLKVKPETSQFAGFKNQLRQQAADLVATQWRMAHATGATPLTTEQITTLYASLLARNPLLDDGEVPDYPSDMDSVTARRVALFGVVPEIYSAVNSFNYFNPDPTSLVEDAAVQVFAVADQGFSRMVAAHGNPEVSNLLMTSLIGKAGSLYAANYRAVARRDVMALQDMEEAERSRHLYDYRLSGLPTGHVAIAYNKLAKRLIDMVCNAVPEITHEVGQEGGASARLSEHNQQPS